MTQYINKGDLVAEIKKQRNTYISEPSKYKVLSRVLSFLDTLEVKEVDLEKEIEKCLKRHNMLAVGKKDFTDIAKHFFKLGFKVSNPITAADRGIANEIIFALNALGEEKMISYDKEIEWVMNKVRKGE